MASRLGATAGPPAPTVYAVEPVGDATTTPSPLSCSSGSSPIRIRSRAFPCPGRRATTTSLNATTQCGSSVSNTATSAVRSSTTASPAAIPSSAPAKPERSTSARKPTWPKFTPSTAACPSIASCSARRIVPSPPSAITSWQPGSSSAGVGAGPEVDRVDVVLRRPGGDLEQLRLAVAGRVDEDADARSAVAAIERERVHAAKPRTKPALCHPLRTWRSRRHPRSTRLRSSQTSATR